MSVESYLRAARDADALRTIGDGRLVAGEYLDPVRDRAKYLVTYCDDRLARDGSLTRALPALARAEAPAAGEVLLRLNAGVALAPPWRRHTTYVRYIAATAGKPAAERLSLVRAAGHHDDLVLGWLASALEEAARAQGEPATAPGIGAEVAKRILQTPGRRSYVALCDGTPIGHATLLGRERDDVTGEDFMELFDILVTQGHPLHRTAVRLLTWQSIRHAKRSSLPLVGNVVHPSDAAGAARASQLVSTLEGSGWAVDYTFWTCSLTALEEAA